MELFLELLKTVVIGVVQGITEWLPVSSTGHMILAKELLHPNYTDEFWKMFEVVIQFGSILAVLVLYFHKLNPLSPRKSGAEKRQTWNLWGKVLVATVPAAIIGLLMDDIIDQYLNTSVVVAVTLILYGIFFLLVESRRRRPGIQSLEEMDYRTALFIGIFQVLALIPGTSRSGSTILGGILVGTSRFVAAEFSFFLAIPVMLGASALRLAKYFLLDGQILGADQWAILLTGMVVAFAVSVAAIKFLMGFVKKHDFKPFGWYRIVLGIIVLLYFFFIK
uniref:Undecaprenyl-diphosphatase n=1 Tax=uncultured Bacillota bacterium TaxID=344338 RepID=A0A650EN09_9FIRM|nr:undecaprenyl-diphosphatase [uncultured Firmicutes bacterium]